MNTISSAARVVVTTAMAALLGCSPQPPKAKFTVDEYLAKPEAMDAMLMECANNPGELQNHPDCVNVRAAAQRQGIGSLRDLPPLFSGKEGRSKETSSGSAGAEPTK